MRMNMYKKIIALTISLLFLSNIVFAKNSIDKDDDVMNIAPQAELKAEINKQKKININVITEFQGSEINIFKNSLESFKNDTANNLEVKFNIINNLVSVNSKQTLDLSKINYDTSADENILIYVSLANKSNYNMGLLNEEFLSKTVHSNSRIYTICRDDILTHKENNQFNTLQELMDSSSTEGKHYASTSKQSIFNNFNVLLSQLKEKLKTTASSIGADLDSSKNINIDVVTDYETTKLTGLNNKLNIFRSEMLAKGFNINFNILNNKKESPFVADINYKMHSTLDDKDVTMESQNKQLLCGKKVEYFQTPISKNGLENIIEIVGNVALDKNGFVYTLNESGYKKIEGFKNIYLFNVMGDTIFAIDVDNRIWMKGIDYLNLLRDMPTTSVSSYDTVVFQNSNIKGIPIGYNQENKNYSSINKVIKCTTEIDATGCKIFKLKNNEINYEFKFKDGKIQNSHYLSMSNSYDNEKPFYRQTSLREDKNNLKNGTALYASSKVKSMYINFGKDNKFESIVIEYISGAIENCRIRGYWYGDRDDRLDGEYISYDMGFEGCSSTFHTNGMDKESFEIIDLDNNIFKDKNGIWFKRTDNYSNSVMYKVSNDPEAKFKKTMDFNLGNYDSRYKIFIFDKCSAYIKYKYSRVDTITFNSLPSELGLEDERIKDMYARNRKSYYDDEDDYEYYFQTPTKLISYKDSRKKEKTKIIDNSRDCIINMDSFYLIKDDGLYFRGSIKSRNSSFNSDFYSTNESVKIMDSIPKEIFSIGFNGVLMRLSNNELYYMGAGNYSENFFGEGAYTIFNFTNPTNKPKLVMKDVIDIKISKNESNELILIQKSDGVYIAGTNPLSVYKARGFMYTKANNSRTGLDLFDNPNITNFVKIPETEGFTIGDIERDNQRFTLIKNGIRYIYGINNKYPVTEVTSKLNLNLKDEEIVNTINTKAESKGKSISFIINNKDNTEMKNMIPREVAKSLEYNEYGDHSYWQFQNCALMYSPQIYSIYLQKGIYDYNLRYAYRDEQADTYSQSYPMKHLRTLTSLTYKRAYELDFANMSFSNSQDFKNYTVFLNDGSGIDFSKPYGQYFPYRGLNNSVKSKINSESTIYLITPESNLDFKFDSEQEILLRDLIKSTDKFINSTNGIANMDVLLGDIRKVCDDYNKFLDELNENRKTGYGRIGDVLKYSSTSRDYDLDIINLQKIKYAHNPNVFENNSGVISNNEEWFYPDNLSDRLLNVGEYTISYKAQDVPTNLEGSEAYKKWSEESNVKVYMKRDPLAKYVAKYGSNITLVNDSYSLDYYSQLNRGVANSYWKYKELFTDNWVISTTAPVLQNNKKYIVSLVVKDKDGFISKPYTTLVNSNYKNLPPVALFELKDYKMYVGEINNVYDRSYDSDGYITNWSFKIFNESGTLLYSDSSIQGIQNKLSTLSLGKYKISLIVKDNGNLLSNEHLVNLEVVNKPVAKNNPPVAKLSINPKKILKGQNATIVTDYSDPDGDKIIEEKWGYNKEGATGWSFSSKAQDIKILDEGYYQYSYRVKDEKGAWSEWAFDHFEILPYNTKPSAEFEFNKSKILENEELKITDTSNPNDSWDVIVKHEWQIKKGAGSWKPVTSEPQTQFAEYGKYYIRHRVLDLGNELSPGLWSDWVEKTIEVLPHNTKPTIEFKIPDSIFINDSFNYKITESSNDNWDEIIERKWSYSKDGGATWTEVAAGPTSFDKAGAYLIKAKVKDKGNELSPGLWSDDYIRTINVVNKPNHQPIAQFIVSPNPQIENGKLTYKDSSYDPDSWDYITERKWAYYDVQKGEWSIESSTPPSSFGEYGTYIIALKVRDKGNEHYPAMWSEYCYQTIDILPINHKPIADFIAQPNVQVINYPVAFKDSSKTGENLSIDEDWDKVVEWEWSYRKKGEKTFKLWSNNEIPNTLTFLTKGIYEVQLKVKDKGNELSPGLWSDPCIKEIEIIDIDIEASVSPNPTRAGQKIYVIANTKGSVEKVTVKMWNGAKIDLVPLEDVTEKLNTWTGAYIVPLGTLDGMYSLIATAYKGSTSKDAHMTIEVKGSILELVKPNIKDSN